LHGFYHPNIAVFHGLVLEQSQIFFVAEYGSKQNLHHLLQRGEILMDKEFQFAFCWELLEVWKGQFFSAKNNNISGVDLIDFELIALILFTILIQN
jgi:hypothetical protein